MEYINSIIANVRIKLNKNIMRKYIITALMYGVIVGFIILGISMVVPIYHALRYALIPVIISLPVGVIIGVRKTVSNRDAALYIDRLGFEEKIITAYENSKYSDEILLLQRQDAEMSLRKDIDKVKVNFAMPWMRVGILFLALTFSVLCYFYPTPAKKSAAERHDAKVKAKKAKDEVEKLIDALSEIDQGELTDEEKARLQEMIKTLEMTKEEYGGVKDSAQLKKADNKYDYKLGDITEKLEQMSAGKNENVTKQLKTAGELASNQQKSTGVQKADNKENGDQNGQNGGQNGNGQNDQNGQQNGNDQNNQNGQQNGNGQNNQNGQQNGNGQNNQNGNQNGNGQNNQNGNQNGNGQNDQNGNQNGNGQNGGEGQNGQNGGEGQNGQGSGSGSGQGVGSAEEYSSGHNHDYVSVNKNIEGKYGDNTTSQYQKEKNGLVWDGEKVPYDTVINEYSNSAYDGIEKGKYPGRMSDVIKDYFSDLEE